VILGGRNVSREEPRWICLACNSGWLDVHRLAVQEDEFQLKLEAAVAEGDFPVACQWRDRRDELAKKRLGLLEILQNKCY
jgi:hypothetical protein